MKTAVLNLHDINELFNKYHEIDSEDNITFETSEGEFFYPVKKLFEILRKVCLEVRVHPNLICIGRILLTIHDLPVGKKILSKITVEI
jgi:hypothetical protein